MREVVIIDYGAGNVRSVQFSLDKLGAKSEITNDPLKIKAASKVILPGVGQASFAMNRLRETGLDQVVKALNQPVLGICLGMQLLFERTEEGSTECLGIIPGEVTSFSATPKSIHMGWNNNSVTTANELIRESGFVFFVHGYRACLNRFTLTKCTYGKDVFSAAVKRDNFYGCQFHPEKSGEYGAQILANFLNI